LEYQFRNKYALIGKPDPPKRAAKEQQMSEKIAKPSPDVIHIQARPHAEDMSEIKHNVSGDSPLAQEEGSTGKRVIVENDGTTLGRHTKQDAAHNPSK
jgi:hypothetical protein